MTGGHACDVRVGIFTDNDFDKINGVTTTLKAVLRYADDGFHPRGTPHPTSPSIRPLSREKGLALVEPIRLKARRPGWNPGSSSRRRPDATRSCRTSVLTRFSARFHEQVGVAMALDRRILFPSAIDTLGNVVLRQAGGWLSSRPGWSAPALSRRPSGGREVGRKRGTRILRR